MYQIVTFQTQVKKNDFFFYFNVSHNILNNVLDMDIIINNNLYYQLEGF